MWPSLMQDFVHLHVHTEYSLLDGANRIPQLVEAAVQDGHRSLAITDHGNLFGAVEFYKACRKADIKPLLGCEVYIAMNSRHQPHSRKKNPYTHLTLLARNEAGWNNLMKLNTIAHIEGHGFRPRVDMEVLNQHTDGLTCLSGCMSGPVNRKLRDGDEAGALVAAGELQDLYGKEHFFLEVMRHGIGEQTPLTAGMVKLQPQINAPLVATNDIHYLRGEDCNTQDAMLCLHQNKKIHDQERWRMETDQLFFRTREQMNQVFGDLPESLSNTLRVAEQVDVQIELGRHRLPIFPVDNGTPDSLFKQLCHEGFARWYPSPTAEAKKRLEHEMKIISQMGFVSYFLIVWDLIHYARQNDIPVGPGRGSAAGSIVAYVMGITRIDPLKYDLLFERFLNSERISMPDIDIDFCKARREDMITYVREKYGNENVCQIITFGKIKAKNAIRDMARVSDMPLKEADKAAKLVPDVLGITLQKALDTEKELQELADSSPEHRAWFKLALQVEGLSRNCGVHAAGVIIADQPLKEIIPLSQQKGAITTQWDMKICEEFGLLKMDFLGLRTLTILDDATKLVTNSGGVAPDLDNLDLEDGKTYELLRAADTEGVFQLESGGMRRLLSQLKPDCYEDIIAVLALFRPGPLGSGLHEIYARRKHGEEEVSFPHPLVEEILQETYGVLIYQEQIMRVAQKMGGFTLNEADGLRKAMGKKKKELMDEYEMPFMDGATKRDVPSNVARSIWDMMVKFAEYGFNKSHSAGYAMVTFQAAYMKAHHPSEFFAATLTHEAFDSDKMRTLLEDARKHEIPVQPPCVNKSEKSFTVAKDKSVRFGLEAIKGVGGGAAEELFACRNKKSGQCFDYYNDLLENGIAKRLTKTTFEGLIKSGACDCYGVARLDLLDMLESDINAASKAAKDAEIGQSGLFGNDESTKTGIKYQADLAEGGTYSAPRKLSDSERKQTLSMEKEALGMYLTRHPLDPYRDILAGISSCNSRNAPDVADRSIVMLAGVASMVDVRGTRKDPSRKYARLKIEDLYGSTEALAFQSVYEDYREMIVEDFIGLFHGTIDQSGDAPTLLINKIEVLGERDDVNLEGSLELRLLHDSPPLEELSTLLKTSSGGSKVRFRYKSPVGKDVVIRAAPDWSVRLTGNLIDALNSLLGAENVKVIGTTRRAKIAEQPRWKQKAK